MGIKTEKKQNKVAQWFKGFTVTERGKGKMPIYHSGRATFLLILIGLGFLLIGIAIGVLLAIGCGKVFDLLKIPDKYYSDFLGGAVGLTVGFALDKICIERINQIFKYQKLIIIIKMELKEIKRNALYYEEQIVENGIGSFIYHNLSVSGYIPVFGDQDDDIKDVEILVEGTSKRAETVDTDMALTLSYNKLINDSISEEELESLSKYTETKHIVEFVFDDIVKNAETMSVLANLPLAFEYSQELITEFEYIQNYLERLENYLNRIDRQEGDVNENALKAQIRWILMQYHIKKCCEVL